MSSSADRLSKAVTPGRWAENKVTMERLLGCWQLWQLAQEMYVWQKVMSPCWFFLLWFASQSYGSCYGKTQCKRYYYLPQPSGPIYVALVSGWKTRRGSGEIGTTFNDFVFRCLFMRRKDIRQLFSPTIYMAISYLKNWPFALATSLLFCFLTKWICLSKSTQVKPLFLLRVGKGD